jgi:hypothetical protein
MCRHGRTAQKYLALAMVDDMFNGRHSAESMCDRPASSKLPSAVSVPNAEDVVAPTC